MKFEQLTAADRLTGEHGVDVSWQVETLPEAIDCGLCGQDAVYRFDWEEHVPGFDPGLFAQRAVDTGPRIDPLIREYTAECCESCLDEIVEQIASNNPQNVEAVVYNLAEWEKLVTIEDQIIVYNNTVTVGGVPFPGVIAEGGVSIIPGGRTDHNRVQVEFITSTPPVILDENWGA